MQLSRLLALSAAVSVFLSAKSRAADPRTPADGPPPAPAVTPDSTAPTPPTRVEGERPKPGVRNPNNSVAMKNFFYVQRDTVPSPRVNQDAMVIESLLVIRHEVGKNHIAAVRAKGAIISSASYDAAKQLGIMVSGATTKIHNPGSGEIGAGWTYRPGDWAVSLNGSISYEHAYRSRGLGLDITRSLFENDTTISLLMKGYHDTVRMIRHDGTHDDDQVRNALWAEVGWTQILTPISLFNLTLTHIEQYGYLASSFGSVLLNGVGTFEVMPSRRSRSAGTIRYKQSLDDDTALELGYRYYGDDWGARGHTLNTQLFVYLANRSVLLEPQYRYYTQTQVDFWRKQFDRLEPYMTSRSDLGAFSGHLFALNAVFIDTYFLWLFVDYDVGLNFYHRTDGLDMLWLTLGFDLPL